MNPWALVALGIGVLLIIIGVKGSYGNLVDAFTGHKYNPGTSGGSTTNPPLAPGPLHNPNLGSLLPKIGPKG